MFRKMLICATLALLAVLPLMGAFAEDVSAATSRVAIIKELKGSVTVKKAGGSKEFKAFARMSLNQGDVLTTGSDGSAVLQFANGSSEDDRMSVTAGTMLTFSKLSNAKGTSTKVSMWSGSAWVDVKSIANENDEFTLETPTAAMGVRGTHLLVSVDPLSGATSLTVAAGVVAASSPGRESGGEPKRVYPTWSALFADSEAGDSEIAIAPVDLELLMSRSDANIVQAILASAAEIVLENRRYVEQYEQEGIPAELGVSAEDLARFKSNTGNLLGAIANQAVMSGLLNRERLDRIIGEVKSQSGIVIDPAMNSFVLSDKEKQQQDEQRKKREAAQERAEQRRQQAEADRKASELLMSKLEEARKAKEEANRKAAEEKRQDALEAYASQLSATEKERFDADKKKRQDEAAATSPSPTPGSSTPSSGSPSPTNEALSSNAELDGFSLIYFGNQNSQEFVQLDPDFAPETTEYAANVPNEVSELALWAVADEDGIAEVKVNGTPLIDHEASIPLGEAGSTTTVNIVVTAEDGVTTRLYQVDVHRNAYWLGAGEVAIGGAVFAAFDPAIDTYDLGAVPYSQMTLPMAFGKSADNLEIDVHVALKYDGYWVKASGATANVELAAGTNVITAQVRYKDPVTWQKDPDVDYYTFTVFREWGLSDLTMSYAYQQGQSMPVVLDQAFNQGITEYAAEVPPDVSELSVLPSVNVEDVVSVAVNGGDVSSGAATNIQLGAAGTTTTVEITLTARDGSTKVYRVEATRQSYSSDASITAFDVNIGQGATAAGIVYEDSKTILLPVPYGTDLTALVPTIGYTGVSLSPESGVAQNFETPVTYTVMAENGTPQVYTVVAAVTGDNIALNLYGGQQGQTYPQASASHSVDANNSPWNAVNGTFLYGDSDHDRWANWGQGDNDWLEVEFASVRAWNRIALYLYNDGGGTQAPASYRVEYSNDGEHWSEVSNPVYSPQTPAAARNTDVADAGQPDITKLDTLNTVTFDTVMAKFVRVIFKNGPGAYVGVVELEVYYD